MTQKYIELRQELQCAQRQAVQWRHKHQQSQIQLQGLRKQASTLRRTIQQLTQINTRLNATNRQLSSQKQTIINGYSTEVSIVKEEISKKQQLLAELRQNFSPSNIDKQIAIRQVKQELSLDYESKLDTKQRKIDELSSMVERTTHQKEINEQKLKLKIQQLESRLSQMQTKHEQVVRQYTYRLKSIPQVVGQDKQGLKRYKRQAQQLRKRWQLANEQLQSALQQKAQIRRQFNKHLTQLKKQTNDEQSQLQAYKSQVNRLKQALQLKQLNKDQTYLRDKQKDREIKKCKAELEQSREEIISRDRKISDLQVRCVQLENKIRNLNRDTEKGKQEAISSIEGDKQRLQKQLYQIQGLYQRTKKQNLELTDRIYEFSQTSITRKNYQTHTTTVQQKQRSSIDKLQKHSPIKQIQNDQQFKLALKTQKGKIKQILMKYVQMKKKCEKTQRKLQKANQKIIQLLHNKIQLGSPKKSPQRIDRTTNQTNSYPFRGQPTTNHTNPHAFRGFIRSGQERQLSASHYRQDANMQGPRNFLSPQDRQIRIQEDHESFYQKSLKIRTQNKYKQIKCANHDAEEQ